MPAFVPAGLSRHLSLVLSCALVLIIGALGVLAGQAAGRQARDVHRQDRLLLQQTLSDLTGAANLAMAGELQSELAVLGDWDPAAGPAATTARLAALVEATRSYDAGAVLLDGLGQVVGAHAVDGALPAAEDEGWAPLRAAVLRGDGSLPISDALVTGDEPLLGLGLPVPLADGVQGLVIGLWTLRDSELQRYVGDLALDDRYVGLVIDGRGQTLAATDPGLLGAPAPFRSMVEEIAAGTPLGVIDTVEDGVDRVTVYASVAGTDWTGLGSETRADFEGGLLRSSRLAQGSVVALLLAAGTVLVVVHRRRESALESVALYDELTGVYNRRGWFALADHELTRARRQGSPRVLLFVDLDGLKQVNDQLGHREGDRAITAAAVVLSSASRSSDLVGRLGGDEFVLLLGEDGLADVARTRVLQALAEHNARSGDGFELRLSLGAEVWFPDTATTLAELVRRADADMYAEKGSRPRRSDGVVRPAGADAPEDAPTV